jgi:MATE family multidrug resistance protein
MGGSAIAFLLFSRRIASLYSSDPAVLDVGAALVTIAAFFQIFDGIQVVATGALRGAGDTRTAMFCHLIGYWFLGLPLGWALCFGLGWGARGLWIGLSTAIIAIGSALLALWRKHTRMAEFAEFST